jgi:hypothetical protein
MTVLGKIMVFVNLAFSLAVAGLVITVFTTRTHWRNGYDDAVKQISIGEASRGAEHADAAKKIADREKEIQGLNDKVKDLNGKIEALNGEVTQLKTSVANSTNVAETEQKNNQAATLERGRLAQERDMLNEQVKVRDQKILTFAKEKIDDHNEAVASTIRANALNEKLQKLMVQFEQVVQENRQMRAMGATPNPGMKIAPVEVKGQVTAVADNLVTVSLGSDHGLSVGTVLQVYRLSPEPLYLGTVTITNLETHRAAGRFTPAVKQATVMKGDTVDTRVKQ